ncbi:hypothetical protein C0995_000961 [Termitomyces sp. Mi166|nr:hypothetical protein C0995_000961 [Termitomyces sp. Mi166\
MTFVWRTGTTSDTVLQITPLVALGPRIVVTFTLGIGLVYLSLVIREFRRYGNAMDEKWKDKWKKQLRNDPKEPQPERMHSQDVSHPHTPGYENAFGGQPPKRLVTAVLMERPESQSQNWANYPEYNSENLARRPKDWRPDYEARRSLIPRIPRTDVEEFKDSIHCTIHATLAYNSADPCVSYDLRYFPNPSVLTFPHLRRIYNRIDFAQLATNPPVNKMRLFHPLLPWYIDVEQHQENGATVQDVIMQVHMELQTKISARDYFNEEMGSARRERIARAFQRRKQGPEGEEESKKGVMRVDYLEDRVVFVGLVRVRDGLWEMKMKGVL